MPTVAQVDIVLNGFREENTIMDESDFEGTLVLEKLASIGKVNDFFDAIDSDDFEQARLLMKRAKVENEIISVVLKKMREADGET